MEGWGRQSSRQGFGAGVAKLINIVETMHKNVESSKQVLIFKMPFPNKKVYFGERREVQYTVMGLVL